MELLVAFIQALLHVAADVDAAGWNGKQTRFTQNLKTNVCLNFVLNISLKIPLVFKATAYRNTVRSILILYNAISFPGCRKGENWIAKD